MLHALSDEQLAALQPEDAVYVRRFRREGRLVRLKPAKRIALVDVGQLEVEVPYDGLALLPGSEPAHASPAVPVAKPTGPTEPVSQVPAEPPPANAPSTEPPPAPPAEGT